MAPFETLRSLPMANRVRRNGTRRIDNAHLAVIMLGIIFLASVALRYMLSDFHKALYVYKDELRYYQIAESIAQGRGISIYNSSTTFQKILYSVTLAPSFLTTNRDVQQHFVALTNSLLMSSGVFPVFLLGRSVLKDQKRVIVLCVLYCLMGDMCYTMTFMSENLYLPLSLWAVLGFHKALMGQRSRGAAHALCLVLGVLTYVLYLCKEIAVVFVIAYATTFVMIAICNVTRAGGGNTPRAFARGRGRGSSGGGRSAAPFGAGKDDKPDRRQSHQVSPSEANSDCNGGASSGLRKTVMCEGGTVLAGRGLMDLLLMLMSFAACFVAMKVTLFSGMGSSYNQTSAGVLLEPGRPAFLVYGFLYYLANAVIAAGLFPVIVPMGQLKSLSKGARLLFLYLLQLLVVSAAVIAYTITVREDFGLAVPRTHLRYVCYLWVPLLMVLLSAAEPGDKRTAGEKRSIAAAGALVGLLLMLIYRGSYDASSVDQNVLNYVATVPDVSPWLYRALLVLLLGAGTALWIRNGRAFCCAFLVVMVALQLWNNRIAVCQYSQSYAIQDSEWQQLLNLESLVATNPDQNFLLVGDNNKLDHVQRLADTFLGHSNVYVTSYQDMVSVQGDGGTPLGETGLRVFLSGEEYDVRHIDYIIVRHGILAELNKEMCAPLGNRSYDYYDVYVADEPSVVPLVRDFSTLTG